MTDVTPTQWFMILLMCLGPVIGGYAYLTWKLDATLQESRWALALLLGQGFSYVISGIGIGSPFQVLFGLIPAAGGYWLIRQKVSVGPGAFWLMTHTHKTVVAFLGGLELIMTLIFIDYVSTPFRLNWASFWLGVTAMASLLVLLLTLLRTETKNSNTPVFTGPIIDGRPFVEPTVGNLAHPKEADQAFEQPVDDQGLLEQSFRYCIHCGEQLPKMANFCSRCGRPV